MSVTYTIECDTCGVSGTAKPKTLHERVMYPEGWRLETGCVAGSIGNGGERREALLCVECQEKVYAYALRLGR